MTTVIKSIEAWQSIRKELTKSLGFVPTMGNLHQGHLSLLQRCRVENEITVLSIFVNPTQFNDKKDFLNYPKTLERDIELAQQANVDFIFAPNQESLYPDQYQYQIQEYQSSLTLEGAMRPGHFTGMLTIVLKLLNIIQPHRAYFGEKDFQQLQLVKNMVKAFFLPVEIIECPIIRNEFGLPLSSRNSRLTAEQLKLANQFPKIFHSQMNCEEIKNNLKKLGMKIDYINETHGRRYAAIRIGDIRLIDNYCLNDLST